MIKSSEMRPKLYSLKKRKSKVHLSQFAKKTSQNSISSFLKSLPNILAAKDLKELASSIKQARRKKRQIIFMYGLIGPHGLMV